MGDVDSTSTNLRRTKNKIALLWKYQHKFQTNIVISLQYLRQIRVLIKEEQRLGNQLLGLKERLQCLELAECARDGNHRLEPCPSSVGSEPISCLSSVSSTTVSATLWKSELTETKEAIQIDPETVSVESEPVSDDYSIITLKTDGTDAPLLYQASLISYSPPESQASSVSV